MTDTLKEALDGGEGAAGDAGTKVEERINKLTGNLKNKDTEIAKLTIDNLSFSDPRFKRAPEFKDKILEKVNAGTPVNDAIASVLVENNAFGAPTVDAGAAGEGTGKGSGAGDAAPAASAPAAAAGAGGSAVTTVSDKDPKKDLNTMTQEDKLTELRRLEEIGEIGLN